MLLAQSLSTTDMQFPKQSHSLQTARAHAPPQNTPPQHTTQPQLLSTSAAGLRCRPPCAEPSIDSQSHTSAGHGYRAGRRDRWSRRWLSRPDPQGQPEQTQSRRPGHRSTLCGVCRTCWCYEQRLVGTPVLDKINDCSYRVHGRAIWLLVVSMQGREVTGCVNCAARRDWPNSSLP